MAVLLLSAHILVAIVFVGSITVAASVFPRYARQALVELPERGAGLGVAAMVHRITRTYALAALTVPILGIVTAVHLDVLGQAWVMVSTALTAAAALVLALAVVPGQRRVLAEFTGTPDVTGAAGLLPRLAMVTGLFNLIWVAVVVLMVLRPGSTTLIHP
jgi:hypothetical protein